VPALRRTLIVSFCLLMMLPAAPALAKKKHKVPKGLGPVVTVAVTGNPTPASGQDSTATATCPSGLQAVGGGFTGPIGAAAVILVYDSFRSSQQAWSVTGRNLGGSGAVTAYAYCRKATRKITDVAGSGSVTASGEATSPTASCPVGTRLIGGGFQSTTSASSDAVVIPQANWSPTPGTWLVTGVNNESGAQTLTAHAYCMSGIAAPTVLTASASASVTKNSSVPATTTSCPAAKKPKKKKGKKRKKPQPQLLSAGGFSGATAMAGGGTPVGGYSENRIGSTGGWLAAIVSANGNSGTLSLTSQGFCV
jgi:hypothetical protein